jgi:two-component system nitrogen regulation response regulator NtrX
MACVLVIKENPPLRQLVAEILENAGHDVRAVARPDEFRADGAPDARDLIVTDVFGLEYVDHMRTWFPGAPILLMTGQQLGIRVGAQALGVDAVLLMPFDLDDLVRQVDALLSPGGR